MSATDDGNGTVGIDASAAVEMLPPTSVQFLASIDGNVDEDNADQGMSFDALVVKFS
ncbi:MAG: hypothetical protein MJ085_04205 [Clostridia bacterium]|nr:hypothetical protein [Clostridia bacterium]